MKTTIFISIVMFFLLVTFTNAQEDDDMFLDDVNQETTECIPEDLSVPQDKYTGTIQDKNEINKLYSFGSEYHKNKNYKAAIPLLWKVYLNDGDQRGKLSIGKIAECYFYLNIIDSTLIACYKGFATFPDHQKLHYYAGYIQNKLGKTVCAIPHYEALVEQNPKNVAYVSALARLLQKEGDCRSIELQKRAVELDPTDPVAQETLTLYMTACGESPREELDKLWGADKTNLRVGRQLSKILIDEGFFIKAVEVLTEIISVEPTATDYKMRAFAYENVSQNSNAVADLGAWLKLEPDNADIMLAIASNYTAMNKFESANSWIAKAINKKPGYGKPYIVLGEMYEAMVSHCQPGQNQLEDKIVYEEAMKIYEKASIDPGFRGEAAQKINNLKPHIRTQPELFMEANAQVKNPCYGFLVGKNGVK